MHNLAIFHKKTWSEYIGNEYFYLSSVEVAASDFDH